MKDYEEALNLENYEEINRADSKLSRYDNYRISYKRRKRLKKSSVTLIQFLVAIILAAAVLMFRFVPVFEPAFNAVKDFIQKDILENIGMYIKSALNG